MKLNIPDLPDLHTSTHTLQHLNSSKCIIDEKWFHTEEDMEKYIDDEVLPLWEKAIALFVMVQGVIVLMIISKSLESISLTTSGLNKVYLLTLISFFINLKWE